MKKFSFKNIPNKNIIKEEITEENKLRKENIKITEENSILKNLNKKLENQISIENNNLKNNQIILKEKWKLNKSINRNSLMVYKILNCIKDIHSLNNKIAELNSNYDEIKIYKLKNDNQLLKYNKEVEEIRKKEIFDKNNNLNILYKNSLQKKKYNEGIRITYQKIIDAFNFRYNYINNLNEANKKIDSLLNQKQQLIEEKINMINYINGNKNMEEKKDNIEINNKNKELNLLYSKNEMLKNKLNKYNNTIKNINSLISSKNSNYEIGIDKKINECNEYKDKISFEIEVTINKFKKEINQKTKLLNQLKDKYKKKKKNEMSSVDKIIF